jgi:hypothetical protein
MIWLRRQLRQRSDSPDRPCAGGVVLGTEICGQPAEQLTVGLQLLQSRIERQQFRLLGRDPLGGTGQALRAAERGKIRL